MEFERIVLKCQKNGKESQKICQILLIFKYCFVKEHLNTIEYSIKSACIISMRSIVLFFIKKFGSLLSYRPDLSPFFPLKGHHRSSGSIHSNMKFANNTNLGVCLWHFFLPFTVKCL